MMLQIEGGLSSCYKQKSIGLLAVIEAMQNGFDVAKEYEVPKSTLKDRLSGRLFHGTKPGPRPYLEENQLADYLVNTAKEERQEGR